MRIRNLLFRNSLLIVILLTLAIAGQFVFYILQKKELQIKATSDQIAREVAGLILLTNEWSTFHYQRIYTQWEIKNKRVRELVNQNKTEYSILLENLDALENSFRELMKTSRSLKEDIPINQSRLLTEKQEWLVTQNQVASQAIIDKTFEISEDAMKNLERFQQIRSLFFAGFLLLISMILFISSSRLTLRITKPLEILQQKVQEFQKGNYSESINLDDKGLILKNTKDTYFLALAINSMLETIRVTLLKLKQQNTYIQTILDNVPLGIAVNKFDNGTATYINNEFENIYGWPKDELVDITNFFKKVYPDETYREEIQRRIMKDIETGDPSGMHWEDIEITTQSGEKRIINAQNIPLPEQNLMISTVQNVTEKKHVEEALRKSEQRFRTIFENSLAVMLLIDPETHQIISANKAAENFYGWKRSEIEKMRVSDINTLNPAEIKAEMEKARKSERIYFRFKHRLASGEVRDVEVYSGKVEIDGKDYLHSIIHDITDQVKTENKLKESEDKYRLIAENSSDWIYLTDVDGRFLYVSPSCEKITGYAPSDFIDDPQLLTKILHPDDLPIANHHHKSIAKSEEPDEMEFRIINRENQVRWISHKCKPVFTNEGKYSGRRGTNQDITKRKHAEEELYKSEERFRVAQDFSPDGFTILHPLRNEKNEIVDFIWVYENQTIARINQTIPEEVKGKRLLDLFPTHKGTTLFEAYIDVANSGKPKILEEVYVGEVVSVPTWLRLVVVPMEEDIAILAQDITERKKAKQALSHSHDLMKYIIEHNQSAVAVHDKNLKYVYVSQRYLEDYRVKEKDVIGKHHYEVFPDLPEKWRKVHQKALRGIVSKADDDKYVREDGSTDWTRWECRPWYQVDGSIGGIIIYTEVINEQKRKEKEISKLNQRLGILIESIQQLSSAQSLDSVQDIVAKSARKLIGADGATLVFRENDHCFYVNEDAIQPLWKGKKFPMNSCISGWVMENKKPVVIEDIFVDDRIPKDLYSATFVKSLAMVPVNISKPVGAIGNYWKEKYSPTETELQLLQTLADAAARSIENINLYAELEQRVKKRTEQLQAVNKELETFTYSVSHDLKAPLRGIDGYSKLLMDEYGESLNEEASHFIKTIRSSTLQMNQLIEDLLSYSRLERSHFKKEKIVLRPFVETLVSNFSEEITKGRFKVEVNIPEVEIVADSTGLSIALRNFLENAIKFSAAKPNPEVEIGLDEKPDRWIISVKDNGVGFEMKYHNRIFEIFQRLHRSEDFPGTGIGLAMVAKALQRMNGKAWAESVPGNGSTFFIEIPKNKTI